MISLGHNRVEIIISRIVAPSLSLVPLVGQPDWQGPHVYSVIGVDLVGGLSNDVSLVHDHRVVVLVVGLVPIGSGDGPES